MDFYRRNFTEFWLTLRSNEVLGLLDNDYLEDYNGIDGQVSLLHVQSGERFAIPMLPVPDSQDVFKGFIDFAVLPDGDYHVQGRVRDPLGNYTVITEVANPFGSERVIELTFTLLEGEPSFVSYDMGWFELQGGVQFDMPLGMAEEMLMTYTVIPIHCETCFSQPNFVSEFHS